MRGSCPQSGPHQGAHYGLLCIAHRHKIYTLTSAVPWSRPWYGARAGTTSSARNRDTCSGARPMNVDGSSRASS